MTADVQAILDLLRPEPPHPAPDPNPILGSKSVGQRDHRRRELHYRRWLRDSRRVGEHLAALNARRRVFGDSDELRRERHDVRRKMAACRALSLRQAQRRWFHQLLATFLPALDRVQTVALTMPPDVDLLPDPDPPDVRHLDDVVHLLHAPRPGPVTAVAAVA